MGFKDKIKDAAGKAKFGAWYAWAKTQEYFSKDKRDKRYEKRKDNRKSKYERKDDKRKDKAERKEEFEKTKTGKIWKKTKEHVKNRWYHRRRDSSGYGLMVLGGLILWIVQISFYQWGTSRLTSPSWYLFNFGLALFLFLLTGVGKEMLLGCFLFSAFILPWGMPFVQSWLAGRLRTSPSEITQMALYFLTLPAVWPPWVIMGLKKFKSAPAKRALSIWMGIIAIIFIAGIIEYQWIAMPFVNEGGEFKPRTIWGGFAELSGNILKGVVGVFRGGQNWMVDELNYATGGLYEARVEEGEHEPLGVTIEEVILANPVFFVDESVSVWGTIHGRTVLDPINVTLKCWSGEGRGRVYGRVIPNRTEITIEDIRDFECIFEPGELKKGYRLVTVAVEYPFTTMSYLKTYFIEESRRRALIREGIDPFDYLKIQDREPVAVYTNGPVLLSMALTQNLNGIWGSESDKSNSVVLSMMIAKNWDGKILNITDLTLNLPEGFDRDCKYFSSGTKTDEGRTDFRLPKAIDDHVEEGRIFKCRLNISDADTILGTNPVSIQYLRLTADYDYTMTSSIYLDIFDVPKEDLPEGETTETTIVEEPLTDEESTTTSIEGGSTDGTENSGPVIIMT